MIIIISNEVDELSILKQKRFFVYKKVGKQLLVLLSCFLVTVILCVLKAAGKVL